MSKKCTPLWREGHFEVKMYKTHHSRTTFGSWDVEKVHAIVARRKFRSQTVQNTPFSDHFWKLRCRKSARRCGAKQISKSKCQNATTTLLHNYTPLHSTTLHYTKLHSATLHYTKLHSTTLNYTPLHYIALHSTTLQPQLHNYTTTRHYTPLH